jgi:hypothetical protein
MARRQMDEEMPSGLALDAATMTRWIALPSSPRL